MLMVIHFEHCALVIIVRDRIRKSAERDGRLHSRHRGVAVGCGSARYEARQTIAEDCSEARGVAAGEEWATAVIRAGRGAQEEHAWLGRGLGLHQSGSPDG